MSLIRQVVNTPTRTWEIIHLIYLHVYLGLRNIQTCSVHSVVRCYLAVNATLIVNLISNSEHTDKSVCYESDEIRSSFWKKPVGISPACLFVGGNIIMPPKVTKLQLRLFNNLHFQHRSVRNRSPKSTNSALLVLTSVCLRRKFEPLMLNSLLSTWRKSSHEHWTIPETAISTFALHV